MIHTTKNKNGPKVEMVISLRKAHRLHLGTDTVPASLIVRKHKSKSKELYSHIGQNGHLKTSLKNKRLDSLAVQCEECAWQCRRRGLELGLRRFHISGATKPPRCQLRSLRLEPRTTTAEASHP